MQLQQDILLYIGQNYLKDTLRIKKLFYRNKDDKLQILLFGEILYYYNIFPWTTIPINYLFPKRNNKKWLFKQMYIKDDPEDMENYNFTVSFKIDETKNIYFIIEYVDEFMKIDLKSNINYLQKTAIEPVKKMIFKRIIN